jgi:hypothetical protein
MYRRRIVNTRQKSARASNVSNRRSAGGNKKVARIQRRPYVPRLVKNTDSIYALAKQVRGLQRSALGEYQKNYLHFQFDPSDVDHPAEWFNAGSPLLIPVNDFTSHPVYRGYLGTNKFPAISSIGEFAKLKFGLSEEAENTSYWALANDDSASLVAYQPITCNLTFDIEGTVSNTTKEQWFRVDVFRQKKVLTHSSAHSLNMPYNLYGLRNMASQGEECNKFNKEYFQVMQTKWFRMPKTEVNNTFHSTRCSVKIKMPPKVLKPDMDGTIHHDNLDVPIPFAGAIPVKDQIFCMLSTNYLNNGCKVTIRKFISYRDQHGAAA